MEEEKMSGESNVGNENQNVDTPEKQPEIDSELVEASADESVDDVENSSSGEDVEESDAEMPDEKAWQKKKREDEAKEAKKQIIDR